MAGELVENLVEMWAGRRAERTVERLVGYWADLRAVRMVVK